jgi:hypothetical protein
MQSIVPVQIIPEHFGAITYTNVPLQYVSFGQTMLSYILKL